MVFTPPAGVRASALVVAPVGVAAPLGTELEVVPRGAEEDASRPAAAGSGSRVAAEVVLWISAGLPAPPAVRRGAASDDPASGLSNGAAGGFNGLAVDCDPVLFSGTTGAGARA